MNQTGFTPPETAPVSQRVVQTVAAETDTDPFELEPLYNAIDPESLNALFEPTKSGPLRSTGSVSFAYADCEVTVSANGDVEADAAAATGSSELTVRETDSK